MLATQQLLSDIKKWFKKLTFSTTSNTITKIENSYYEGSQVNNKFFKAISSRGKYK